jgi:DNA-binding SARP family transcriptional activator/tetratricopeptide (TPR) repeat protein/TolB-like protein
MLEVHAFGPVDLRPDNRDLASVLRQPKRLALLLYLVLARPQRFQRRDTLLALFWPELDEAHARKALSQSLSFLRRGLPESTLRVRGQEEVGLDPGMVRCDVIEFEQALAENRWADALELYRGELLTGFHVPDAPGFEAWLDLERERLRELAAGAAWSLSRQRLETGQLVLAERAGQLALRLVPTDESPARDFIRALAAAGDRAAALRFYDRYAAILLEELEVAPAPETAAVMAAIRAGEISLVPVVAQKDVAVPTPVAAVGSTHGGEPAAPVPADTAPAPAGSPPAVVPRTRWLTWPPVAVAALVLALAGAVAFLVRDGLPTTVPTRLAVLPFENRTGEPAFDALGAVAADWITGGLSRIDTLQAVATPTIVAALAQPGAERDRPRWIAHRTGAAFIITGYFLAVGDSLEFRAELVDPFGGSILDTFDPARSPPSEPTRALGPMREQIVGRIALRLESRMASMLSVTMSAPPSYDAYRAHMAGVDLFFAQRYTEAIRELDRAWAADSSFAAPGIWIASAYWNLGQLAQEDSILQRLQARRASLAPVELLPLEILEAQFRGDNAAGYRISRDALRRLPSSDGRFLTGMFALRTNRPREAVRTLLTEPRDGPTRSQWLAYHSTLTLALHCLHEYRQELAAAREARARFPDRFEPRFWQARALIGLGRIDEALSLIDESLFIAAPSSFPGDRLRAVASELRAHGHPGSAQSLLLRALEWYRTDGADGEHRYGTALALASLGASDSAAAILRQLTLEQPESLRFQGSFALALAAAGRADEARLVDQRLAAWQAPYVLGRDLYWRAAIAANLGEEERALALLRAAVARGVSHAGLSEDEALRPLWGSVAFRAFMRPSGD